MASNNNALRVVIQGVDRLTAPIRRINKRIESMTSPIRQVRAGLRQMAQAAGVQRLASSLGNVRTRAGAVVGEVSKLTRRFATLTAAAGGAAVAMVNSMTQSGDEAAKTASRLGVGVEWLQEMRYAAERSGVATATFDMSIQRAGRRLGEFAATGKGEAAPVIEAMGLQIRNAAGEMRPMEELLPEIGEKLNQLENPMMRNAAAMKLFDSEGVAMVQLLGEGAEGMDRLRARARELGVVIGEDSARQSEKFQDGMTDLKAVLTGIRNVIGTALLPVIGRLRDEFIRFLAGNRERIKAFARDFAERLPGYLEQARASFMSLLDGMRRVMDFISPLVDRFGAFNVAIAAVAAVVFGPLLMAIGGLVKALVGLGTVLLTTPVGWFLLAVAAIAGAVYLIYREWDAISQWFEDKFSAVRDAFDNGLIEGVYTLLREFNPVLLVMDAMNAIIEYITGVSLYDVGADMVDSLWDGIKHQFDRLTSWFEDKIKALTDLVPDWMKNTGSAALEGVNNVTATAREVFAEPDPETQSSRSQAIQDAGNRYASTMGNAYSSPSRYANAAQSVSGGTNKSEASVVMRFENMPRNARVEQERNNGVDLGLNLGYSMGGN